MNEFNAQTGGRYVYVDDVLNLQDLALAFGHIFDECDNFIVSGCKVSGNSIGAGYIYLNGKLRYFSGASGINKWPQYLYEKNTTDSVHYASGDTKVGRNLYGVAVGSSVPASLDSITNKTPVSMVINQTGGTLMKDAFFGKYSLILNPANLTQVLNGSLKIAGDLEVVGVIKSLANAYQIAGVNSSFDMRFNNGNLVLATKFDTSNNRYAISMENGTGIVAYINDTQIAKIDSDGIVLPGRIQASKGIFGNVGANANHIYNHTEASNTASVNINMVGLNGGAQYFRNTNIGDGKGVAIIAINGQSKDVNIAGVLNVVSGATNEGLVFLLDKAKTNTDLQKSIIWKDSNKATMGLVGFSESTDMSFRITNNLSSVFIYGASNSFVDLGPAIKENGQLLSEKYVLKSSFNTAMSDTAKNADVFSKTQSDARYAQLSNGFADYISYGKTQAQLRAQIGAIGTGDLSGYVKKDQYLADMGTSEANKKKIRDNIGAAGTGDFQAKLKDTGWVEIKDGLYARQIGNIVSIQGSLRTVHSGTIFNVPNTIDPPTYAVYQSFSFSNKRNWTVSIKGNSRECKVLYCDGSCGNTTDFSITYMV